MIAFLLFACLGDEPSDGQDTTLDSQDPISDSGESGDATILHRIEHITQTTLPSGHRSSRGITSQVNGYTYFLEANNRSLLPLSEVYVAPRGSYCLKGGKGEDCEGGEIWVSDQIDSNNPVSTFCADNEEGRLFLVSQSGGSVDVVDVNPAGSAPYTYNKVIGMLRVPEAIAQETNLGGPCHYDSDRNTLLLTAPSDSQALLLSVPSGEVLQQYDLEARPRNLWYIESLDRFLAQDQSSLVLLKQGDLTVSTRINWDAPLINVAVDNQRAEALVVYGDGKLDRVLLGETIEKTNIPMKEPVTKVAMDSTTGLDWVLTQPPNSSQALHLLQGDTILDTALMDTPVTAFFSTGDAGDLMVASNQDEAIRVDVYDVRSDPADARPPLYGMLVTALEQPADPFLDKPCLGSSPDTFEAQAKALLGNAQILADLNIPITVAITTNFMLTAERCERLDLLDSLAEFGFELGVMVHNRPCYECTSKPPQGENPDSCAPNSPFYCDPSRMDCCFPSHEDYCDWGDYDCYFTYVNEKIRYVEERLPGGAQFIVGADRHGMWGWNWRKAYAEADRIDGSKGYDVTFFAQAWAYDGLDPDDPRGKNPAPWLPKECAPAWAMASEGDWTDDSAFSDMLYLPGVSISTVKLAEWQSTGLHMLDFLTSGVGISYSEQDYDVLTGFLRRSLNHRSDRSPNTFYFHIHDMGMLNLADYNGEPTGSEQYLQDWIQKTNKRYVDSGELVWTTPGAIRTAFPPRD